MKNVGIKFKDKNELIEINFNKNIVFHGVNGRGKTRTLKTLFSLIELIREKKTADVIKLVNSMNIEYITIGGIKHNKIFNESENATLKNGEKYKNYYKKNENTFKDIQLILETIDEESVSISNIEKRAIRRALRYIYKVEKQKSIGSHSIFLQWLRDIDLIIVSFKNVQIFKNIINEFSLSRELEIHKQRLLKEYVNLYNSKDERKIQSIINDESSKSLFELAKIKPHFIYSGNADYETMSFTMKKRFQVILDNINLIDENNKTANHLIKTIKNFKNDLEIFNRTIEKYVDVQIIYTSENELIFNKSNEEIEFEKLSSGEQKIIFIFIEMIFNKADIYLIDEPEISLSLNYQNRIINDLHKLAGNSKIFIATHAPYIYEDFISYSENNISVEV